MPTKSPHREDFHVNYTESRESNYHKELNSRKFMRVVSITDYFSGILGYNVSLADADSTEIEWKYPPLSIITHLMMITLLMVKFFNELNRDIYAALRVVPPLVTANMTFVQRFRIFYLEMELKEIYCHIFGSWDNDLKNGINDKIAESARRHILFPKLFGIVIVTALISYLLRPFSVILTYYVFNVNETFTKTNILLVEYPFAIDTMWKWALLNLWEGFSATNTVMLLIGNDLAFVQMCGLLSLQTQVIGNRLTNIVGENDSQDNDCRLVSRLLGIGKQHSELIEMCRKIEDAFNPGILALMIGASITLCTAAISMEKELSTVNYGAAATMLLHFSGVMLQTIVYCNAAQNLSDQLGKISKKIYESQWFGHSKRFQKMIIAMMLRSNKTFQFKTYGLYNVDRVQLTKIMALTYNLIMALRKIKSFKAE